MPRSLRLCPSPCQQFILDELAAENGLQTSAWLLSIRYLGPLPPAETERMQCPSPATAATHSAMAEHSVVSAFVGPWASNGQRKAFVFVSLREEKGLGL